MVADKLITRPSRWMRSTTSLEGRDPDDLRIDDRNVAGGRIDTQPDAVDSGTQADDLETVPRTRANAVDVALQHRLGLDSGRQRNRPRRMCGSGDVVGIVERLDVSTVT